MHLITLLTIGLLCLVFKSTRLTSIAGLTLLSLIYPPVIPVLAPGGIDTAASGSRCKMFLCYL